MPRKRLKPIRKTNQSNLILGTLQQPVVVAYGKGVDSTGMILGMHERGWRPDLILNADMPDCEREETDAYLPVMQDYLASIDFPPITVVRNEVQDFKHWPPYQSLYENCLTNGTLPSASFGFHSCSQKWKIAPQNRYCASWQPALEYWEAGGKVLKLIGFDAGKRDVARGCAFEGKNDDPRYEYRYLLQEWGWDRERCIQEIRKVGLPVPVKSSCFFCVGVKPAELRELSVPQLRRIVILEARAKPRLTTIQGLWREPVKGLRGATPRPGSMTEYIRQEKLLPAEEIDRLWSEVPKNLVLYQAAYAQGKQVDPFTEWIKKETETVYASV